MQWNLGAYSLILRVEKWTNGTASGPLGMGVHTCARVLGFARLRRVRNRAYVSFDIKLGWLTVCGSHGDQAEPGPVRCLPRTGAGTCRVLETGGLLFPKQFAVRGSQFFLKMCPPFVSLLVSALFRWPCSYNVAFLFICLPGLSLLVSALFRWPCSISIHLFPRSLLVSALFRWPCSYNVAFLFICLPGLSLLVSALFRWPCSISIHLCPRSLLVSALFHWLCSISIHLSPRSVTAGVRGGVRPFPLAMQHLNSFVSQVCRCWCPPFSVGHVAFLLICPRSVTACVRPFPLATQHSYSFPNQCTFRGSQFFLKTCPPFLSLLASALFRWPCSVSIHLHQKWFLYFCLPSSVCPASVHPNPLAMQCFYSYASQMICLLFFSRFGACAAGLRPFPLSSISTHSSPRWFLHFPKQVIYC